MKGYLIFIVLVLFLTLFLLPPQLQFRPPQIALVKKAAPVEGFVDKLAPATLNEPRKPYHPLNDWIPDAPADTVGCLTAGCCYETSFKNRIDLVGNFRQMTNNYRHAYPDSCSAPLTQFVTAFYKTTA